MGPFSYVPFMECNHEIISLFNNLQGNLKIDNDKYILDNGIGYIEKDFGVSFPSKYIWIQANNFKKNNSCISLSIATIPFNLINFKGFICILLVNGKEYRFATYNNSKIREFEVRENKIFVKIKRKDMLLEVLIDRSNGNKLIAPVNGIMNRKIKESIDSKVNVKLYKSDKLIFEDNSKNGGVEVVS